MAMYINTNVSSLSAQKNLAATQSSLSKSFNRLSSGFRINTAADDAAGLAISDNMTAQIRSLNVAERNANDGVSMAQTAEGTLGTVNDILGRMRELATQGANGALTSANRTNIKVEFTALQAEIKRVMSSTTFNGKALLSSSTAVTFQVGANNKSYDKITVTFGGVSLTSVITATTSVTGATGSSAMAALDKIDTAINSVSQKRASFGAVMNRFQSVTSNIQTARLNLSAANSRIRDVDVAEETSKMARTQVMQQAGVSVLSQANQAPQIALKLLG